MLAGVTDSPKLADAKLQEVGMRLWREGLSGPFTDAGYNSVTKYNESGEGVAILWKKSMCEIATISNVDAHPLQILSREGKNFPFQPRSTRILRQARAGTRTTTTKVI